MEQHVVIGIDLGGTNTKIGIVNRNGEIIARTVISTRVNDFDDYIEILAGECEKLAKENDCEGAILGVGVGAPNANYSNGTIEFAPNLPWKGVVPFTEKLSKRLKIPTYIMNDANAAAYGEKIYGYAREFYNFIMITLGTGVGSGIFVDDRIVNGQDGLAGELGHFTVRHNGRLCHCGRRGCLERYASASGVVQTVKELLKSDKSGKSLLADIDKDKITSYDVYLAAKKGDSLAKAVFDFTGDILGEALANFSLFSEPEAIILFGGLVRSGDLLMDPLKESFDRNILPAYKGKIQILTSKFSGSEAAIIGASSLVWK